MNEQENKLRKIAGKGLVILFSVLLLCIFFSGTLKTLTTPKVRITSLSNGKLKDTVSLTGTFHVSEAEEIGLEELPENVTMTVKAVYAFPGQKVQAGDTLLAVEVSDYDAKMKEMQAEYMQMGQDLLALEQNPVQLLHSDKQWIQAWDNLQVAEKILLQKQLEGVVDGAAQKQAEDARKAFIAADRIGIDADTHAWYKEKQRLEEERGTLLEAMKDLKALQDRGIITAPHAGYILSVGVQAGSPYNGKKAAVTMSANEGSYCLRAYTANSSRAVSTGMSVLIPTPNKTLRTKVVATGYDDYGKAYADIEVKEDMMNTLGGITALLNMPVTLQVQYTADTTSLQLPVSALRSNGMEDYVYIVLESENLFGASVLKLEKQAVTVEDQSDTMVSVTGIARDAQVAYMEDKTLQDGMEVMPYGTTP